MIIISHSQHKFYFLLWAPQIFPSIYHKSYRQFFWKYLVFCIFQNNSYICNACSKTDVLEQMFYMKLDYIR